MPIHLLMGVGHLWFRTITNKASKTVREQAFRRLHTLLALWKIPSSGMTESHSRCTFNFGGTCQRLFHCSIVRVQQPWGERQLVHILTSTENGIFSTLDVLTGGPSRTPDACTSGRLALSRSLLVLSALSPPCHFCCLGFLVQNFYCCLQAQMPPGGAQSAARHPWV